MLNESSEFHHVYECKKKFTNKLLMYELTKISQNARPEVLRHTALILRLDTPVIAKKMLRNIIDDTVKTIQSVLGQYLSFFCQVDILQPSEIPPRCNIPSRRDSCKWNITTEWNLIGL